MTTSCQAAKPFSVRLLHLDNIPIFEQLKLEEALLRADTGNWCIVNTGSPPAVVMGISGKPELLVDAGLLEQRKIPLIRRFSGGGTVYIDPRTVFVTWICNAADTAAPCFPDQVHCWAAGFFKGALPSLGMALRENDYVIGERKWGGNAQYLTKGRWLHHTSLLWDYDPEAMNVLLQPKKAPAYRSGRVHHEFLISLKEHFSEKKALEQAIVREVHGRFHATAVTLVDVQECLQRPHRSSTCHVNL